jgi:hypothetical protein
VTQGLGRHEQTYRPGANVSTARTFIENGMSCGGKAIQPVLPLMTLSELELACASTI